MSSRLSKNENADLYVCLGMSILFPKAHAHSFPIRVSGPRHDCEAITRVESILVVQHHGYYYQDPRPAIDHERPYQTLRCAENGGTQ